MAHNQDDGTNPRWILEGMTFNQTVGTHDDRLVGNKEATTGK